MSSIQLRQTGKERSPRIWSALRKTQLARFSSVAIKARVRRAPSGQMRIGISGWNYTLARSFFIGPGIHIGANSNSRVERLIQSRSRHILFAATSGELSALVPRDPIFISTTTRRCTRRLTQNGCANVWADQLRSGMRVSCSDAFLTRKRSIDHAPPPRSMSAMQIPRTSR